MMMTARVSLCVCVCVRCLSHLARAQNEWHASNPSQSSSTALRKWIRATGLVVGHHMVSCIAMASLAAGVSCRPSLRSDRQCGSMDGVVVAPVRPLRAKSNEVEHWRRRPRIKKERAQASIEQNALRGGGRKKTVGSVHHRCRVMKPEQGHDVANCCCGCRCGCAMALL